MYLKALDNEDPSLFTWELLRLVHGIISVDDWFLHRLGEKFFVCQQGEVLGGDVRPVQRT